MKQTIYGSYWLFRGSLSDYRLFDKLESFLVENGEGDVLIEKYGVLAGKLIVVAFQATEHEQLAINEGKAAHAKTGKDLTLNQLPPLMSELGFYPDWFNETEFKSRFGRYLDNNYFVERLRLARERKGL